MTVLQFRKKGAAEAPYLPNPRNGEVYATESHLCRDIDGEEIETFDGFAVVHVSRSGDSASIDRGYETMADAEAGALREAMKRNAVLLTSNKGGQR